MKLNFNGNLLILKTQMKKSPKIELKRQVNITIQKFFTKSLKKKKDNPKKASWWPPPK